MSGWVISHDELSKRLCPFCAKPMRLHFLRELDRYGNQVDFDWAYSCDCCDDDDQGDYVQLTLQC